MSDDLHASDQAPATPAMLCSLPPPALRQRRAELQAFLDQAATATALPNGVEFQFLASPELAHALLDFMLFERVCCSALTYELRSFPDHSRLALRLSGPPEQVESLRAIFPTAAE